MFLAAVARLLPRRRGSYFFVTDAACPARRLVDRHLTYTGRASVARESSLSSPGAHHPVGRGEPWVTLATVMSAAAAASGTGRTSTGRPQGRKWRYAVYELRPAVFLVDCAEQCWRELDLIHSMRGICDLPILAVADTADADVHGIHAGGDSVVPKPISHDELQLRIWRMLERRGYVREVLGDALVEFDRRNHIVVAQATCSTSARSNSASSRR